MRLSIFTTATNPAKRGDDYHDAINCYKDMADELIVVSGSNPNEFKEGKARHIYNEWPQEFSWELIGQQFQRGYEAATGDWVIHADLDFIFHEKDIQALREALEEHSNYPALSFYKWQFILPDRYNLKSRLVLAVNKKKFGNKIKFNGGGDLCQPTLNGDTIELGEVPQSGIAFYNYEKMTKTKEQITDDVERMDDAYLRHFGQTLYSTDELTAWEGWLQMAQGRFNKPQQEIPLSAHPKYVQHTIEHLTEDQWGHSGFGELRKNNYA